MKKFLFAGLFLAVAGVCIGYYMWNKPHQNISKAKPAFEVTSDVIVQEFQDDEIAANTNYLGKIIQVSGQIRQLTSNEDGTAQILLTSQDLLSSVSCNLQEGEDLTQLNVGDQVTIKGKCTGSLMDVILQRCVIVK